MCELASYYFLPRISDLWKVDPPYANWSTYADAFTTYVQDDMKKATPFDLNLLSNPSAMEYLSQNEYDRGKNAYIAINLLPIFESDPELWSAVPLLFSAPERSTITEALHHWHDHVPEKHQNSIERILRVFSMTP